MSQPQPEPCSDKPTAFVEDHDGACRVVLMKRGERYVFQCRPGDESRLLHDIVEQIQQPQSPLDWYDAAVVSHQLGLRMSKTLSGFIPRRHTA